MSIVNDDAASVLLFSNTHFSWSTNYNFCVIISRPTEKNSTLKMNVKIFYIFIQNIHPYFEYMHAAMALASLCIFTGLHVPKLFHTKISSAVFIFWT